MPAHPDRGVPKLSEFSHRSLPKGLQRAILTGRPVIVGFDTTDYGDDVRRIAYGCGRGGSFALVLPGQELDPATIRFHHRAPQIPDDCEWHGLPALTTGGDEAMEFVGDPATEEAHRRRLKAWAGRSPGFGIRVAPGDGSRECCQLLRSALSGLRHDTNLDPRPPLDLATAMAEGTSLVINCACPDLGPSYFIWTVLRAVQECEMAGLKPPIVVASASRLRPLSRILGWRILENPLQASICAPERDTDVFRCQDDLATLLAERSTSRIATMETGCTDGVTWARGDGRSVLAVHWGDRRATNTKCLNLLVADIEPGPRVTFHHIFRYAENIPNAVIDIWCNGFPLGKDLVRNGSPLHRYFGEFITTPQQAAFRNAIANLLGPDWTPFVNAATAGGVGLALMQWALAPSGAAVRRRQFVLAFESLSSLAFDREVTACVDAGKSPVSRLAAILDCPEWVVRRLAGQPHLPLSKHVSRIDYQLPGKVLARMGHGIVPATVNRMEWYWLCMRCHALAMALPDIAYDVGNFTHLVCGDLAGGWNGLGDRVDFPTRYNCRDVRDFLLALNAWVEGVAGITGLDPLAVAVDYGSMSALWDASRAWHSNPVLCGQCERVSPLATWPVAFQPVDLGDGWSAHAIGGMQDLVAEGGKIRDASGMEGLHHCVATYGEACLTGRSHVVSLRRTEDGRSVRDSTVQLSYVETCHDPLDFDREHGSPRAFTVVQHRGHRNRDPEEGSVAALDRLLAMLDDGTAPLDPQALAIREPGARSEAIDPMELAPLWRPILPRRWARLDFSDLIKRTPR